MTSTDLQGFGCVRDMGTKWPKAGTRDSCGPQPTAQHGTSPTNLDSVAQAALAAAVLAAAVVELPQAKTN